MTNFGLKWDDPRNHIPIGPGSHGHPCIDCKKRGPEACGKCPHNPNKVIGRWTK